MVAFAIRVEGLSKQYRIGGKLRPYTTLQDSVSQLGSKIAGIFSRNGRQKQGEDWFWALKDISFEVKYGEVIGIIGRNGAGKTTLLKILSRITGPTEGRAEILGRVGSLLEVGTGFHPELTGRDNIYLNGAILGMKRAEIDRKFDEIVEFSGVSQFIDTPVKRYSSGMGVRLAFAVAAHLEPEILIVDEVLAVGDVRFQKKCMTKMDSVAGEGRTVLFVSHNMGAIGQLCSRALLLNQGRLVCSGATADIIQAYLSDNETGTVANSELSFSPDARKQVQILGIRLSDHLDHPACDLNRIYPFRIMIEYEVRKHTETASVEFILETLDGVNVCVSTDLDVAGAERIQRNPGRYLATVEFPGYLLNAGSYRIRAWIRNQAFDVYDEPRMPLVFHLEDHGTFAASSAQGRQRRGLLAAPLKWDNKQLQ